MSKLKKKILITAGSIMGGSVVILLLLFFVVIGPATSKLARIEKEIYNIENLPEGKMERQLSQSKEKLAKLHNRISDYAVESEKWVNMMTHVSKMFEEIGIKDYSSKDTTGRDIINVSDCQSIGFKGIKVDFNSDFYHFARFINALEGGRPVVFVDSFKITKAANKEDLSEVSMELRVLIDTSGTISADRLAANYSIDPLALQESF